MYTKEENRLKYLKANDLLTPKIRNIGEGLKEFYQRLATDCENAVSGISTKGLGFLNKQTEILSVSPDTKKIIRVMTRVSYIRPLICLWNDEINCDIVPCNSLLLGHIDELALHSNYGRIGRIALRELCQLFFSKYNTIDSLDSLCYVIKKHMAKYEARELLFGLDKFKYHAEYFLNKNGHLFLVKKAEDSQINLNDAAKIYGIQVVDSIFYEESISAYYIDKIKKLNSNQDDKILYEIQDESIYNKRIQGQRRLGHSVIEILIDKLIQNDSAPSDLWRDTILAIANDPRVSPSSKSYRDWWAQIKPYYSDKMSLWLAEVDMELFLQIIKEFAVQEGDSTILRMYSERQFYLRGIFKKKLVKKTRLFLGKYTKSFVERNFKGKYKPYYIYITGANANNLAAFYINIGSLHLIEGTHNFALRIFAKLPPNNPFTRYITTVTRAEISTELTNAYINYYSDNDYGKLPHAKGWQYRLLDIFRSHNIYLEESDIISSARTNTYRFNRYVY